MKSQKGAPLLPILKRAINSFFGMVLIWLLILILIRFIEILWNGMTHQYPKDLGKLSIWALLLDLIFWMKGLFWELLIFFIFYFFSTRIAKIVYGIIVTVLALIQVGLIQYFNTSLVLLGADIYGYSIEEIKQTIGASGGIGLFSILGILILIGSLALSFKFLSGKIKIPFLMGISFLVLSFLLAISPFATQLKPKALSSDFADNLVINKSDYFFKSSYAHFYPEMSEVDIYSDNYSGDFGGPDFKLASFDYVDESNYPFLHQNNVNDVLSPFFNQSKEKPNIVIILVEGLGRAFTNQGAYLGNFTPYLDSISQNGLYWKNFLSEGGRTFAVLPALTASLPFAKNGFLELGNQMPNHLSLFNLLKYNGYHTSFYYGGDASFDNMKLFLQKNQVDEINDGPSFPKNAIRLPAKPNGFSWGYSDNALFSHFLNTRKPEVEKGPQISVILTV
ncbi:MAG: sulfatase-like hydrolase/transferase, partial [Bacteroidetes bacterium]|nr:sulfatase-like hydrolase/transferase [Bacteroidota bacterium]